MIDPAAPRPATPPPAAGRRAVDRVVRIETAVSMAINGFIPAGLIWLAGVPPPAELGGATGLVQGLLKAAGLATLAITLVLTAILRLRLRRGGLPRIAPADLTGPARLLPRSLPLRAIVMALAAMILLVPIGAGVAAATGILPLDRTGALVVDILFGALIGLTMAPPIVRRALADTDTADA